MIRIVQMDMLRELDVLIDAVGQLLQEIGATPLSIHAQKKITSEIKENCGNSWAFKAITDDEFTSENIPVDTILGIITVSESYALFAHGRYGIINELFVFEPYRRRGVASQLMQSVKQFASNRSWPRLDVASPPGNALNFYKYHGFVETAHKLKWYGLT